mmetsp:Transcript_86856/g.193399  ORF Transcript_86856/g.193399 Transcript_86856/m.193399 type:complete len:98 (+) Transcript_86856:229-522(+)
MLPATGLAEGVRCTDGDRLIGVAGRGVAGGTSAAAALGEWGCRGEWAVCVAGRFVGVQARFDAWLVAGAVAAPPVPMVEVPLALLPAPGIASRGGGV